MRQYASKRDVDYLEKLQDLRKEYTPVLAGRKTRNGPKEAQTFLDRRKEAQKANHQYKPRPVTTKSPVKQVRVDLSAELEPRVASPDPAESILIKPLRFRIARSGVASEEEPIQAVFPREISKKPPPVLHIETHNLTIVSKQAATAPVSATQMISEIESTLLFGAALYRPSVLPSFPLFPALDTTPSKPSRKRSENPVIDAISFDEFMNKVVLTPKDAPKDRPSDFTLDTSTLPRSQTTTPGKLGLLQFKEAAEAKERKRRKRLEAAIKIQSLVRGFLSKRRTNRLKRELSEKIREATLRETAKLVKLQWAKRRISAAISHWMINQRAEKSRLFSLFQSHCAVFIQKHWRGYQIRRLYQAVIARARRQQALMDAMVVGWRLRRVMKLEPVQKISTQIREMETMIHGKGQNPTEELVKIAKRTLPSLKENLAVLIEKMQGNGTWMRYLGKYISSVPQTPKSAALTEVSEEKAPQPQTYFPTPTASPKKTFEDRPIRPMQAAYTAVIEERSEETRSETPPRPKRKFSNFLRKTTRVSSAKPQNPECDFEEEKPLESLPVPAALEAEDSQQAEESNKAIRPYLKRKSQTMKTQKLKWKVTRKIDCWVDRGQKQVSEEPKSRAEVSTSDCFPETPKREPLPIQRPLTVDELEAAFSTLLRSHTDAHAYFKRPERRDQSTFLPQFQQFSYFVAHFTEDIFRDTFVALEQHYKLLCREDWLDS